MAGLCTSSLAVALFILSPAFVSAFNLHQFYPHGPETDTSLPTDRYEVSSPEITLSVPIRFYGENYTSIFVNANGLVSFLTDMPTFYNLEFPLDYPIIAPLYTNVDLRGSGQVLYRETQDPSILEKATANARHFFPSISEDYRAKSVFIATWLEVGYFENGRDKVNTYQVCISTNGEESFAEIMYADNGIQWITGTINSRSGLPHAKAQAGLVATDGRMLTLKGSGTDQSIHLDRWSNAGIPGYWIFRVGNIGYEENVEVPDIPDAPEVDTKSCATGSITCHSNAECVDDSNGFCCLCKQSYYGNGHTCLKRDIPVRVNGKVDFSLNNVQVNKLDLQGYIVTADGRSYVALSKVPSSIGYDSQLLNLFTSSIAWLFSKSVTNAQNGYQLTAGQLNYTGELSFPESGHRVSIKQTFHGMDVFDQLRIEAVVQGSVPVLSPGTKPILQDYTLVLNKVEPGVLKGKSTHVFKFENSPVEQKALFLQSIYFKESCQEKNVERSWKLKVARNFIAYEERENILRFASSNKVSLFSETSDPCSKVKCVANSTCIVEEEFFKCICNPGFETVYVDSDSKNFGCYDINECSTGRDSCHRDAICINEIGSFNCQCKPGFEGDGHTCVEKSPCAKNPSSCIPANSACTDPNNLKSCTCHQGFLKQYVDETQEPFICVDINECEYPAVCDTEATCENYAGGYTCICNPGYTGNGYSCFLADDRTTCAALTCRAGAECVEDASRGAHCACLPGYAGDGNYCVPSKAPTCEVAHDCSPYAECVPNSSTRTYECKCLPDFRGDGYTCVDARPPTPPQYTRPDTAIPTCLLKKCWCPPDYVLVNEICVRSSTAGSEVSCNTVNQCHSHAQCVFVSSTQSYQCLCNAGYEGNGRECTKVETNCLNYNQCDVHASCKSNVTTGKFSCVCNQGYEGDGNTCNKIALGECGNCGSFAECVSEDGISEKQCRCFQGYIKIGVTCQPDDDGCAVCHPDAECVINKELGKPECRCPPEYIGDGTTYCDKKPLDCHTAPNCSPYANCIYNDTISQYKCLCRKGFEGDGLECHPIKTCIDDKAMCSKDGSCVINNLGTFHCECNEGFYGDGFTCKEVHHLEGDFLLLNQGMTTLRLPFNPTKDDLPRPILLQVNQNAIGISVDCMEGRVYWSDIIGRTIKSSKFNGKDISDFMTSGITSPEGLSLDWVNRFLFWTDSGQKAIVVANLDTKERSVLVNTGLVNPRGIAVHPFRQKVFWSDWNRAKPKLEWSNLDGSDRAVFLEGSFVVLPNSLAIDWDTDEVCWADAGTKSIECMGIDNRFHRTAVTNLSYPFGLAITKEKYYWTDWLSEKVESATRNGKKLNNLQLPITGGGKLYGIVPVFSRCPRT